MKPMMPGSVIKGLELSRFLVTQRLLGFPIADEPYFDEESTSFFTTLIRNCRFYLEYGCGGTTVLAAKLNKPFVAVDTDRFFLNSMRKKIGELATNQRLVYADIGLTKAWGVPLFKTANASRLKMWRTYPELPWQFIDTESLPI